MSFECLNMLTWSHFKLFIFSSDFVRDDLRLQKPILHHRFERKWNSFFVPTSLRVFRWFGRWQIGLPPLVSNSQLLFILMVAWHLHLEEAEAWLTVTYRDAFQRSPLRFDENGLSLSFVSVPYCFLFELFSVDWCVTFLASDNILKISVDFRVLWRNDVNEDTFFNGNFNHLVFIFLWRNYDDDHQSFCERLMVLLLFDTYCLQINLQPWVVPCFPFLHVHLNTYSNNLFSNFCVLKGF